ncbi:hypothetical protein BX070DRAFT_252048 [Coemansia spiralis]|nr:hypothetical protein BX070DRAFT_252048 [Coemansia spiralis]
MFGFCNKKYSIDGKVVLLTGALGSIGKNLARSLVEKGAQVALIGRQPVDTGNEFARVLNNGYEQPVALYFQVDLRKIDNIMPMFELVLRKLGRIDILINNAAVEPPLKLCESSAFEEVADAINVNLLAPIELMRLFEKHVRHRTNKSQGVVVNVSSMLGLAPMNTFEVYGATKAALINLTRASRALAPQVRVSAIAPYHVLTPRMLDHLTKFNVSSARRMVALSMDQVCATVIRCIQDTSNAGEIYTMIGDLTYTRTDSEQESL